jgi:4-diphosphocytidyl-2-C-methyl-D-erythritol kinase
MKVKSFAKINLNLHIHPKKTRDKLTPLTLINHQINIYDSLEFINQPYNIELICYPKKILPNNDENIVYQAALKLKEFSKNPNLGVKIILNKNIPIAAGMAGGSSNAAITLKSLIKLWHLKISHQKLLEIAFSLGQDVPYFFSTNLCYLTGYGDIPHPIKFKPPKFYLVIIYPEYSQKPSTGWMFQHLDFSLTGNNLYKSKCLLSAIKSKNKNEIFQNLHNDFETIVFNCFSETQKIADDLLSRKAVTTLLSGSGLGIIGFFKTRKSAQTAFNSLKKHYSKIFLTSSLAQASTSKI